MLDFIIALEKMLKLWPDNVKWSLVQIAEQTNMKVPYVVEAICDALCKNIEVHDPLSFNDVNKALSALKDQHRIEIEMLRKREMEQVQKAVDSFDTLCEKIRVMERSKNWRGAYKTLSYFYGMNEKRLPKDIKVQICNDCIRLGMKENINFQELCQWLRKGVTLLIKGSSEGDVEDALDFLDCYGDYFVEKTSKKGENFLTTIFLMLKPSAMEFNLTGKFNEIAGDLKLTTVMDVYL